MNHLHEEIVLQKQQAMQRPPFNQHFTFEMLEAMHWMISPYEDQDLEDLPHILNMARIYNKALNLLGTRFRKHTELPYFSYILEGQPDEEHSY
jgi:hypothetical protein